MKTNDVSRKVTIAIIATLVIVSFFFPPILLLNLPLLIFRTLYKWAPWAGHGFVADERSSRRLMF